MGRAGDDAEARRGDHGAMLPIRTLLATAALLSVPAVAGAAERPVGPRLERILDRAVTARDATFPGVSLHVRGTSTWSGAAGTADLATKRPMRATDRFRAGSIMKTFVATVTLQLVEERKLSLDAPLPAVLPAHVTARFPEADRITVRMLLNHTSGLGEYSGEAHDREIFANPGRRWTVSEVLDRTAALPRAGAPGERHSYSNANYNLLGLVIERATGKSWRTAVRERVIRPLRLTRTSLPAPGTTPSGSDIAHGYDDVDGRRVDLTRVDSSMAGAAGGNALLTTPKDLSRFLRALLAGKLFQREATLTEMRTFVPATDENGLTGYGLGLQRYVLPGGVEMIGHVGGAAGYFALMLHAPEQDLDVALAINRPGDPLPVLLPTLELML